MTSFSVFSRNGQILPNRDATVSLLNIEYSYGYGVYETLKVRNGIVYFVDQHLERLAHSASVLEISLPFSQKEIKTFLMDYIVAIQTTSCNIKMLLIGGKKPTLFIFATAPLYPDRKLYKDGASLISYMYERLFPTAKTLNMLPSFLAYKKAKEQGCYDALLIDKHGTMLEGTRTNFFVIKGKTILTAPQERVLAGVTFLTLRHTAKQVGFSLREEEIPLRDLALYDGACITSTSTKIMPVKAVDDFSYQMIHPSIKTLAKAYDVFLEESQGVFH